jgi:hypothetical protein
MRFSRDYARRSFDAYIQSRCDSDHKTQINYQQAGDCFIKRMGKSRLLCDVTPAGIDAWRLWIRYSVRSEATGSGCD